MINRRFRRSGCWAGKSGFTLTEIMIASMIFLIASLGFSFGLIAAMKTSYMAYDHYRSMTIARNRVQRARSLAFESLGLLSENMVRVDELGNNSTSGQYFRCTSVSNVADNCMEMTVSVFYLMPHGITSPVPVSLKIMLAEGM